VVDKICLCGHLEKEHKYLNKNIEQMIQAFVNVRRISPQYDPDLIKPVGYTTRDGKFYTYDSVMEMLENLRNDHSYCVAGLVAKDCKCKVFKADNLKYLEVLCERKASQIIY
jgi:hypothetical protein